VSTLRAKTDAALVVLEPPGAVERLAQDHPHPPFANDGRRNARTAQFSSSKSVCLTVSRITSDLVAFQNLLKRR